MDFKTRVIVAVIPFAIAALIGFLYLQPAISDYGDKSANAEKKKQENAELAAKLTDQDKVKKEKRDLEIAIEALRGSVPKKPDMEILNIDLEKMATDSGLDIISVRLADKETLKKSGLDESGPQTPGASLAAGKEKLANQVKGAAATAGAAAAGAGAAALKAAGGGAAGAGAPLDAGVAKNTVQIKLIGDYRGLMTFVHKLETYQRVVAVSEVHASVPKANSKKDTGTPELPDEGDLGDGDNQGDPARMVMSMLLTTYYLP
jgi:Tfp pilus assembly protein PilO